MLFATETFSIGLNMLPRRSSSPPSTSGTARSSATSPRASSSRCPAVPVDVVSTTRGIVIMMFDEKLEPSAAKTMVKGEADRLNSAFHLDTT